MNITNKHFNTVKELNTLIKVFDKLWIGFYGRPDMSEEEEQTFLKNGTGLEFINSIIHKNTTENIFYFDLHTKSGKKCISIEKQTNSVYVLRISEIDLVYTLTASKDIENRSKEFIQKNIAFFESIEIFFSDVYNNIIEYPKLKQGFEFMNEIING